MDPVTARTTIDRPREQVFEYLVDVANHSEFLDHFCQDFRLTREDSRGVGAGARFRLRAPLDRFSWADVTLVEAEAPRRLVLVGRTGKFNRVRLLAEWVLDRGPAGVTEVELSAETEPATAVDRLREALGGRLWVGRQLRRSLRRLKAIHEEDRRRGRRATIAGGPRKPASQTRL